MQISSNFFFFFSFHMLLSYFFARTWSMELVLCNKLAFYITSRLGALLLQKCRNDTIRCPPNLIWLPLLTMYSDGQTFLSADDFMINLWNLEVNDQCFNIIDTKPPNMEDLTGDLCIAFSLITYTQVWRSLSLWERWERRRTSILYSILINNFSMQLSNIICYKLSLALKVSVQVDKWLWSQ